MAGCLQADFSVGITVAAQTQYLTRHGIGDIDELRPALQQRLDDRDQKGVMRTAEDDAVDTGSQQGADFLFNLRSKIKGIRLQGFDVGGPAGAGDNFHLDLGGMGFDQVREALAAGGGFGGQDCDVALEGTMCRWFDAGFDADNLNVWQVIT